MTICLPGAQINEAGTAPESFLALIGTNKQLWSEFLAERFAGLELPRNTRELQRAIYYTFTLPGPAALPIWDPDWCSYSIGKNSQTWLSYYSTGNSSRTLASSQLGLWEPEQESMPTFRPMVTEATWASEGKLKQIFERAIGEYFEDGVESNFTLRQRYFMRRAGQDAAAVILNFLSSGIESSKRLGRSNAVDWSG